MSQLHRFPTRRSFVSAATLGLAAPTLMLPMRRALAAEPVIVETNSGRLRGLRDNGAVSFKGIPYAADTGGANRFMAPRPVASWTGVRDALQFGDRCVQQRETFGDAPVLSWYAQTEPFSENCCVLNVFTPETGSGRRPVMVYIHGGGYITGGGGGAVLDGSNLAKYGDVVVVTVNHRLNVFGYTDLGGLDPAFGDAANAGQLDLIAALAWIRNNIAAFGGNPDSVTLFGQSGGGSKITVLMGMPAARGLFHRAINMSGTTGFQVSPPGGTQAHVTEILKELGIDKANLRRLQELPADALIKARLAAVRAKGEGARPVIDGRHLPAGPMTPEGLALHSSVPLVMGNANTEATFYFGADTRNFKVTTEQVRARIKAQFGLDDGKADALMAAYLKDEPMRTPADILAGVITDTLFRVPMIRGAETKANARQAPVYLYNFVWNAPVDGGIWHSPHAIDIPFAFGNTDRSTTLTGTGPEPVEVSRNLMAAFVAFARTGNPNNPRMPQWPPFDTTSRPTMAIDLKSRVVNDYHGTERIASTELRLDPYNRSALMNYRD